MKPASLTEALDESLFGGKAAQLAAAVRAGLPVPDGTPETVLPLPTQETQRLGPGR